MTLDEGLDSTISYFRGVLQQRTETEFELSKLRKIKEITTTREKQERVLREQLKRQEQIIAEYKKQAKNVEK